MAWPIYLYLPNIVGYFRILANVWAFAIALSDPRLFVALYFFSFFCDYVDGRFATWFNQKSTFGAVLDMVTDRMSTTCLLLVLSHLYLSLMCACMALLVLDLTSHWYQMYSSFLVRKASHKDVAATDFWLMRWYYGSRPFMAYCCIGAELLYLVLYLDSDPLNQQVQVSLPYLGPTGVIRALGLLCLPGWALKQITNVVQLKTAADACVEYDLEKTRKSS